MSFLSLTKTSYHSVYLSSSFSCHIGYSKHKSKLTLMHIFEFVHSYSLYYIFYVICAVIYCSLCCIYEWLDPGTYMIARFMSFINRVLQSGIRAVSTVGRSLDRTGRVLGLILSNPYLLKLFYYYTPWILWLLPVSPWFLSLKNSFRRFCLESVIWPPWVGARWPFIIIR